MSNKKPPLTGQADKVRVAGAGKQLQRRKKDMFIYTSQRHKWHKLVKTLVFVGMKFNPRQASDKFHINKNAGVN